MKKSLFTIIALMAIGTVRAQIAQTDSNYVEVGVNTLRVVSILIDDKPTDFDVWNPYLFTLEGHVKRLGIRGGFGQDARKVEQIPTAANGKVRVKTDTSRVDYRIGLDWEFHLHRRWSVRFGVDYFAAKTTSNMETEFLNEDNVEVKTIREIKTMEKGLEPFAYFQYHITPRISLGTELLWRVSSSTTDDIDSNSLNEDVLERKFEGKKRIVMAPTALFLCARF